MKAPPLAFVALVALTLTGVALASAGPTSPLYLTFLNNLDVYDIYAVQGSSVIQTFPEVYNAPLETPIAVYGDVRTTAYYAGDAGGQYTLSGTPTGTSYVLPSVISSGGAYDSTSDGAHNYLVDFGTGWVYQTARDYTNPVALFNTGTGYDLGITYDRANNSLWISGWNNTMVQDYSLHGTLLSSFSTGHFDNAALALDPADHTLWLVSDYGPINYGYLEQYSTAGALLSVGPYVGYTLGGEFNTPEPGTLIMFGSGILGLASMLRRKISLSRIGEQVREPLGRYRQETLVKLQQLTNQFSNSVRLRTVRSPWLVVL